MSTATHTTHKSDAHRVSEDDAREAKAKIKADTEQAAEKVRAAEEEQRELDQAYETLRRYQKQVRESDVQLAASASTIKWHAGAAAAVAILPTPFDLVAIAGVELKLVGALAERYGVPFSKSAGKAVIGALAGSFGTNALATHGVYSIIKVIPIFGQLAGAIALPTVAFASTYALGRVFEAHFAAGGTLLDFDAFEARAAYKAYLDKGRGLAA